MLEKIKNLFESYHEFCSVINKFWFLLISLFFVQGLGFNKKIFPDANSFVRLMFALLMIFLFWLLVAFVLRFFGAGRDESVCFYCSEAMPMDVRLCKKCAKPRYVYRPFSITTGFLTLFFGMIIFGIIACPPLRAKINSLQWMIFASALTILGVLAISRQRWVFIVLVLVWGYQTVVLFYYTPNFFVCLLLLVLPILSLFSFFAEYSSLK